MLRIAFVSDYLSPFTGGPRIMADIFTYLVKQHNYDVILITGIADPTFYTIYENYFNIIDLKIYDHKKLPHQQPSKIPGFLLKAGKILTRIPSLDIFHFNSHLPNILPYLPPPPKPKVCTIFHLEDVRNASGLFAKMFLPIFQNVLEVNSPCTLVHVPTEYTAEQVIERRIIARRRVIVIPCGIDLSNYLAVRKKPEPGTFLMIGRLEPRKHYEHAILAAKLARKYRKDLKLYIIGDGSLRPTLEQKIRAENLENTVKLLGNIDEQEKLELLAKAEALIHLGYPEGFGLVIIEALATGTPIITYDLPPMNEIIRNHIHGVLIEKGNIVQLVRSIIDFNINNYEEGILRAKSKQYDLRKITESFHILYTNLLQEKAYGFSC